ncbi:unnamed protein product, partial [Allacma fusca]
LSSLNDPSVITRNCVLYPFLNTIVPALHLHEDKNI